MHNIVFEDIHEMKNDRLFYSLHNSVGNKTFNQVNVDLFLDVHTQTQTRPISLVRDDLKREFIKR